MNETETTRDGLRNVRPGREALTGVHVGPGGSQPPVTARPAGNGQGERGGRRGRETLGERGGRGGRGEQPMVPDAEFRSYYGQPILNEPVWQAPDIPGYLFLGGLAGAGSVIADGAHRSRRRRLARTSKLGSAAAAGLSLVALVHDLGRPARFLNMLRVFKPTSPMSVGSWVLAGYVPAAAAAAASDLTGMAPGMGALATAGAAVLGPAVATYTAALVADTAVPAWHDGHRELPFLFAGSAMSAAAGLGMVGAPVEEAGPARALAVVGWLLEAASEQLMLRRMGLAAEAFRSGKAKRYHRIAVPLVAAGGIGAALGRRSRALSAAAGTALLAGSALTRFAIFEAGVESSRDPKYTVVPQRQRLDARNPG
jgi:formate-dependent nitrite reductase membrane component NrfD